MQSLHNFPSIVVWVPFNEAWGQFKTKEIVDWTAKEDPSRLINAASGGNFDESGNIMDLHNYPEPLMPDPALFGHTRIVVLGEFGGLGLPLVGHTWQEKNNWGYQSFKNNDDLFKKYAEFIDAIPHLISKGLSAAVYTQTTDVEIETNGLMTYDRKVIKMPVEKLKEIHQKLYKNQLMQKIIWVRRWLFFVQAFLFIANSTCAKERQFIYKPFASFRRGSFLFYKDRFLLLYQ